MRIPVRAARALRPPNVFAAIAYEVLLVAALAVVVVVLEILGIATVWLEALGETIAAAGRRP